MKTKTILLSLLALIATNLTAQNLDMAETRRQGHWVYGHADIHRVKKAKASIDKLLTHLPEGWKIHSRYTYNDNIAGWTHSVKLTRGAATVSAIANEQEQDRYDPYFDKHLKHYVWLTPGNPENKTDRDAIITLSNQIPHTQLEHINFNTPTYYNLNYLIEK